MRQMMQIALAHFVHFVKCVPFVSKMNDKNFVYTGLKHRFVLLTRRPNDAMVWATRG